MAEGNGVDQGEIAEMLRGVLLAQERMQASQDRMQVSQDRMQASLERMQVEQQRVARDLVELRREVASYHGSVMGHGILITELDERVTRLENRSG